MGRSTRKLFNAVLPKIFIATAALLPSYASALGNTRGKCSGGQIETAFGCVTEGATALEEFIRNTYTIALFLGSTIAVIMVVIGGIQYITSSGNPEAVQSAKDRISSALLGLALLILAILLFRTLGVGEGVL